MNYLGSLWQPVTDRAYQRSRFNTWVVPLGRLHPSSGDGIFRPDEPLHPGAGWTPDGLALEAEARAGALFLVLKTERDRDPYHGEPHVTDLGRIERYLVGAVSWAVSTGVPIVAIKAGHEPEYRRGAWDWMSWYAWALEEFLPLVRSIVPAEWPVLLPGNKPTTMAFHDQPSLLYWVEEQGGPPRGVEYSWQGNHVESEAHFLGALGTWGSWVTEDIPIGTQAELRARLLAVREPALYCPVCCLDTRYWPAGQLARFLVSARDGYWSESQAAAITAASSELGVYRPGPDVDQAVLHFRKLWQRARRLHRRQWPIDQPDDKGTMQQQMQKFLDALGRF